MSTQIIKPEALQKAVTEAIAKYGDEATEKVEAITKSVTRQAVKTLKAEAPTGGSYARGWSHKTQKGGAYKLSETVYNRIDYQLTHLLEKPHDTGGGGHYPKNVDYTGQIAEVEDKYTRQFEEEVKAKL